MTRRDRSVNRTSMLYAALRGPRLGRAPTGSQYFSVAGFGWLAVVRGRCCTPARYFWRADPLCLQIAVSTCSRDSDLHRELSATDRGVPLLTGVNGTLIMARPLEMEDVGPLRAVTRGVVPLRLRVTSRLTCCRCLLCLLASQTALTPSADPLGKLGLHYAHLPLLRGRAMASQAGRVAAPPANPPACDARRRQRAGTVQIPSVRPWNEVERSSDLLIRRSLSGVQRCPARFASRHDRCPVVRTRPPGMGCSSSAWLPHWLPRGATRMAVDDCTLCNCWGHVQGYVPRRPVTTSQRMYNSAASAPRSSLSPML